MLHHIPAASAKWANLNIECGLALSVLLSRTSVRRHIGQNVADLRGAIEGVHDKF